MDGPLTGISGGAAPYRSFAEAISVCFSKFATFSGRASRSEYWCFWLFCFLLNVAAGFLDRMFWGGSVDFAPLSSLTSLVLLLPTVSVTVRRLHDTDRSGWWFGFFVILLLALVIFSVVFLTRDTAILLLLIGVGIYGVVLLVLMMLPGKPGPNRFG